MNRLEIKADFGVDDTGKIEGIAWPWGAPDSKGDTIVKGAFGTTVTDMPMLYGHNLNNIIGLWDEITETERGLEVKGHLSLGESDRAKAVRSLIQSGMIGGLSVAFRTLAASGPIGRRTITALNLHEISVVPNPVNRHARILSMKSAEARALAIADAIQRATAALSSTKD